MRLDQKVIFIRAKLRWLMQDMDQWGGLVTLAQTHPKYKDYKCTAEELLLEFKERISKELDRMDDPKACSSSCKWMYFCELEKGHDGIHREGGLGWSNEQADGS